ncbi:MULTISPECIES: 50S ribosomal protein L24 [Gammaproteobacteria]|jgi:large subunit ribosomal protein L24|uniref:Large ribosomal subunit protein uL24 n=2 Tax=Halomonadaceae TaxID=28256 RepID=A0A2A2EVN8_9GAMM|nr:MULTISPECIES: 50S ribosomal protein L24 [Gammaproteobacteria]KAA8982583.1 50S ribosomal protein L24 [Halospina sp. K52047b]MYL27601.1 50S ribosomal protein L24 [Halomonas utahensis]MYL75938.1 50S ribosomal protein L24 [Halomonas sp. 22501_18_FS]PAU76343.1 50S ribosomal protein L24 [Halovibrio salipaludis]
MNKIKRDDEVVVTTGKDRNKRGKVLRIVDGGERVVVSGINMVKKHTRPNPMAGTQGGIIEKEAPIHISNVAIYNPQQAKADRVGFQVKEDGTKVRIFRSTQEVIDNQ